MLEIFDGIYYEYMYIIFIRIFIRKRIACFSEELNNNVQFKYYKRDRNSKKIKKH